jgi:hypothetical protein
MICRMDLMNYCTTQGGTAKRDCPVLARLAADSGYSPGTLYMVAQGHKSAGPRLVRSLSELTAGVIEPSAMRPDYFPQTVAGPHAGRGEVVGMGVS